MSALNPSWPVLGHVLLSAAPLPGRRALAGKAHSHSGSLPRRGDSEPEEARPSAFRRFARFLLETVVIIFAALLLSTLIKTFGVQQYVVPSGSMEQTLQVNDHIVVSKIGDYERGDIIVFEDKLGWLPPSPSEPTWYESALQFAGVLPPPDSRYLVKRLIGLPGDHVVCCTDGRLTVNGQVIDEPYIYPGANPSDIEFDIVIPAGRVFVLGDHRNNSADSRYHLCSSGQRTPAVAFPAVEDIKGPVVAIGWPPKRWTGFSTPEAYASVPSPGPPPEEAVIAAGPGC
ncbi:MAG: signal peptidase I [Propionibacteriaceae bacterium]|nr:signal peptidase I [Propionibacteriaceae bacterium]